MIDNENLIPIPGRLHSVATEGHVAGADEIYDDSLQKNQATINHTAETNFQNLEGAMDKAYVANSDNGMGRITLKKNIVNEINTLTQSMMQATNTIYVIIYDFTLGENITIPENCILEFDGGSISGEHIITGQNTCIKAGLVKIFSTDVTLADSWNVAEAYPEWFGAKGDGATDDSYAFNNALVSSNTLFLKENSIYKVNCTVSHTINIIGNGATIKAKGPANNCFRIICNNYTDETTWINGINIENINFDGNYTENYYRDSGIGGGCLEIVGVKNINLQNINVYHCDHNCISFWNVACANVQNIHLHDNGLSNGNGYPNGCCNFSVYSCSDFLFDNCKLKDWWGEGFLIQHSNNITISNCIGINQTKAGTNFITTDGNLDSENNYDSYNIKIENCYIDNVANQGIEINSTFNFEITSCIIMNYTISGILISEYTASGGFVKSKNGLIRNILCDSKDNLNDIYIISSENIEVKNVTAKKINISDTATNITKDIKLQSSSFNTIYIYATLNKRVSNIFIENTKYNSLINANNKAQLCIIDNSLKKSLNFNGSIDTNETISLLNYLSQQPSIYAKLKITTWLDADVGQRSYYEYLLDYKFGNTFNLQTINYATGTVNRHIDVVSNDEKTILNLANNSDIKLSYIADIDVYQIF